MRRIRLNRILCPVDFSTFSRRAFERASAIAKEHHAELRTLYVHAARGLAQPSRLDGHTHAQLIDRLRQFMEPSGSQTRRLGAAVRSGDPATQILRFARTMAADLIVMGSRGSGGPLGRDLGAVTSVVASRSVCPTLIVPVRAGISPIPDSGHFREIVCAVDPTPSSRQVLAQALSLAQESQGRVTVVHVTQDTVADDVRDTGELLSAAVPEEALHWCDARVVVATGSTATEIVRLAGAVRADLIVIGPPRSAHSTTHHVLRAAQSPVLVAHEVAQLERLLPSSRRVAWSAAA